MSDDRRATEVEITAPALAGTVADVDPRWVALVLGWPAPGTASLAVEGDGEHVTVSIWSYLYGAAAAARDEPRWRRLIRAERSREADSCHWRGGSLT